MNVTKKVVFHSARQEDVVFYSPRQKEAERKERRRHLAEYCKESLIIMVLSILFGAFSIQMGLWQGAPVQILISAL